MPIGLSLHQRLAVISMKHKSNNTLFIAIVAAMVGLFLLVLFYVLGGNGNDTPDPQIEAGIAYLEALEQKDPADVQAVRKQIHQAHLDAQAAVAKVRVEQADGANIML